MVKYIFAFWGLKTLFFTLYGSFRIVNCISFKAKNGDVISVQLPVQKLMEVHVNTSKKLTRVLCLIKNLKKKLKKENGGSHPQGPNPKSFFFLSLSLFGLVEVAKPPQSIYIVGFCYKYVML
jgi:hypothetical protein